MRNDDLLPFGESRMTVKEVAEALNVDRSTITRWIAKLFPDLASAGKETFLDEIQVTRIKQNIGTGRNDLCNIAQVKDVTTPLEIEEMTIKVIAYHRAEADRLRAALAEAAPKIQLADAIGRSDRQMSITDAAKHFGLHPRVEVFPYLREHHYLTAADMPTQAAIDAGYLALKETVDRDGNTHAQAVVEVWQLENWRAHVVHQVKRWLHEIR